MKVWDDLDFYDILSSAWQGGKDTAIAIDDAGKGDEFMELLEEMFDDGVGRVELNDYMWFDAEDIFARLGIERDE